MTPIEACREACQYQGDIVEIGAGTGETTIELLKLAKEFNKKVIVIDPFTTNDMPPSYVYSIDAFLKKTDEYKDYLEFHRLNSLSHEAWLVVKDRQVCFAFIDGLQYLGAVWHDLRLTAHARVQCLDDMDRSTNVSQVPHAIDFFRTDKDLTIDGRWAYLK